MKTFFNYRNLLAMNFTNRTGTFAYKFGIRPSVGAKKQDERQHVLLHPLFRVKSLISKFHKNLATGCIHFLRLRLTTQSIFNHLQLQSLESRLPEIWTPDSGAVKFTVSKSKATTLKKISFPRIRASSRTKGETSV